MGVNALFVDRCQKQRHGAHHVSGRFRKQVQVIGDGAAKGIDLIRLWRQFDRFIAFAPAVLGEEADRVFAGIEGGAKEFVIEAFEVAEFDSGSA
ncbi:hypothetical protein D3C87_1192170 [compost metagenome]